MKRENVSPGMSGSKIADIVIRSILILFCVITIYPFLYVTAYSLSNAITVMLKPVTIYPVDFTLNNFKVVFQNKLILNALGISTLRTLAGIIYCIFITGLAAYAISKEFPGKRALSIILIIPMYIGGGLIPTYVLINQLGLNNNFLVFVLPWGFSAFYMLVMRTYFQTIPESLGESARLDGAGEWVIFTRIIMPLSMPIIATIAMFVGVAEWNSWFDGMLYITNKNLKPMATFIMELLQAFDTSDLQRAIQQKVRDATTSPESVKMATILISTIPIICIYPFLQKYFIKGVMIGAVKA